MKLSEQLYAIANDKDNLTYGSWAREVEKLEEQISALQAENIELRKCVELYANTTHWHAMPLSGDRREFLHDGYDHGYEPAQECLAKWNKLPDAEVER